MDVSINSTVTPFYNIYVYQITMLYVLNLYVNCSSINLSKKPKAKDQQTLIYTEHLHIQGEVKVGLQLFICKIIELINNKNKLFHTLTTVNLLLLKLVCAYTFIHKHMYICTIHIYVYNLGLSLKQMQDYGGRIKRVPIVYKWYKYGEWGKKVEGSLNMLIASSFLGGTNIEGD